MTLARTSADGPYLFCLLVVASSAARGYSDRGRQRIQERPNCCSHGWSCRMQSGRHAHALVTGAWRRGRDDDGHRGYPYSLPYAPGTQCYPCQSVLRFFFIFIIILLHRPTSPFLFYFIF